MSNNFKSSDLKSLSKIIKRGISPKYINDGGVIVLNQRCIRNQKVAWEDAKRNNLDRRKIPRDRYLNEFDIVVNSTGVGTLGRVAQIRKLPENQATSDSHVTIVRPNDLLIDPLFLGYAVKAQEDLISILGEGSTGQIELSRSRLGEVKIFFPIDKNEQKAIAGVLSVLDDKIDLLHQQNQTFEALAQTLFRQWFVEEAGDDWEETSLDKIADYLNGIACQKYPPKDDIHKLPVLKIRELGNGISDTSDWASTDLPEEYFIHNGDVIFSWSGSLMIKIWDGEDCILNQHLFKITSKSYPKWFFYFWTKHHLDKFISIAEGKSTTMGHIKRSDLSNSEVFLPPTTLLKELGQKIDPLVKKIILNNLEVSTLQKTRDLLLPKLMSGEVRVRYDQDH